MGSSSIRFSTTLVLMCILSFMESYETRFRLYGIPEQCREEVMGCLLPAIRSYTTLVSTERGLSNCTISDSVRKISLSQHCRVVRKFLSCYPKLVWNDNCVGVEGPLAFWSDVIDRAWFYICEEQFDILNENYRCLLTEEISESIAKSCSFLSLQDIFINGTSTITQCVGRAIEPHCGLPAAEVVKTFIWTMVKQVYTSVLEFAEYRNRYNALPAQCQKDLTTCLLPVILDYYLEDARDISLSKYCRLGGKFILCILNMVENENCDGVENEAIFWSDVLTPMWTYICRDEFDNLSRSYSCLLTNEVAESIVESCSTLSLHDIWTNWTTKISQCVGSGVEPLCGVSASEATRTLIEIIVEQMTESFMEYMEKLEVLENDDIHSDID